MAESVFVPPWLVVLIRLLDIQIFMKKIRWATLDIFVISKFKT